MLGLGPGRQRSFSKGLIYKMETQVRNRRLVEAPLSEMVPGYTYISGSYDFA